ncbi:MAG TPA: PilZ domain-containing protein [Terriglobales bacterium]
MHEPERRQAPRFNADDFTYISFGADNGGSVLNLSADGLCFSSISPIHKNGPVRLWFSNLRQRVETEAEIVWVGQSQKTGGLRFVGLSDESREKIRTWNDRSVHTEPVRKDPIMPVTRMGLHSAHPANGGVPSVSNPGPIAAPEAANHESALAVTHFSPVAAGAQPAPAISGFSRGLLTGLLISAVFGGVLLFHSYRREIGETLIHLGEQVATKPQPEVEAASPATSAPVMTAAPPKAQAAKATAPVEKTTAVEKPEPDVVQIYPPKSAGGDVKSKLQAATPALAPATNNSGASTKPQAQSVTATNAPATQKSLTSPPATTPTSTPATASVVNKAASAPTPTPAIVANKGAVPPTSTPAPAPAPAVNKTASTSAPTPVVATNKSVSTPVASANKPAASTPTPAPAPVLTASNTPAPNLTAHPETHSDVSSVEFGGAKAGPPPQMFFEVGKFKNPMGARETTARVAGLGLPSEVQQKGHLFGSSYVVLVGPYKDDVSAAAAHSKLASNDINALPFERGSRSMEFRAGVNVNGSNAAGGDCEIKWESYPNETTVKFFQRGILVATAKGNWVSTDEKHSQDAIVIRRGSDGSRTLIEVRFAGMKRTLVLGKSS